MSGFLRDHRVFWRQFRENFHATGAVMPSGRALGRALARFVGSEEAPQRVLEVGPGTGAVTAHIVRRLKPCDSFDLVELNAEFVRRLNERFEGEGDFRQVAAQSRVLHQRLEDLPQDTPYDVIVSGLPLNNFSVAEVTQILDVMGRLLKPGATLSFFEYIAIRPARAMISGKEERTRLHGIGQALAGILKPHEVERDWVWPNVPPAWVHHVRWPAQGQGTPS